MGRAGEGEEEGHQLFETRVGKKSRVAYRIFGFTVFIGICVIWVYRLTHIPIAEQGRWAWIGMFMAELWSGFYWIITLSVRLNKLYEDIKFRIEAATEKGSISKEVKDQHKGFLEWNSQVTKQDHQSIVQILIDGRKPSAVDEDGHQLPALVYLAREKRPQCPHNFKAGSMNALIRVSSEISNAPIILNLDCDMYSNDSDAIKEALCFFMDEKHGHKTSYVQHPQSYNNITKNDIYSNVASTTHLMGLMYGCPVEDIITGLTIQCRGWKPVYYYPETRKAFVGIAPTTLDQALVQHKRLSEGMFQIFLSKYCPFVYGHGKIKLGAQMGYCVCLLWAPCFFPVLYYVTIRSICLPRGIALFPEVLSLWFLPFAYVYLARNACSIAESLTCGDTLKAWCNSQQITTSYAFAFVDTIIGQLGLSQIAFAITAKVVDEDVSKRYEQEMLEFGSSSVMFDIVATLAMLNLFSFVEGIVKFSVVQGLIPQIVLCWLVVVVNVPVYQALFFRNDKGRFPFSVVFKSIVFASLTCVMYGDKLPAIDIFVCTADPKIEPPTMVINTVLSALSYNYPPEKLSIFLSDDGGSEFTFYALMEASQFSKHWIPFSKKFRVEPRSPAAYFSQNFNHQDSTLAQEEWLATKKLYEDMKFRIERATEMGSISKEVMDHHKGFAEWNSQVTKQNHQSIVQILIDGKNPKSVDDDVHQLPTLVYLAREKRPQWPHNFKAGSMNALIRVSSEISNAPIILNLDCDMYSNDSDTIKETLCFFMDEEHGHKTSYVQYPQNFNNITKNDIYSSAFNTVNMIEFAGMDGFNAAFYLGTGCFHRRESLCGLNYSENYRGDLNSVCDIGKDRTIYELEEGSKVLANCSYEADGTRVWVSRGRHHNRIENRMQEMEAGNRKAFVGIAPTTLDQALVRYKRWTDGFFQISLSKYCPFIYGHGKIKFGAQMGYCVYLLFAPNSFPTLYYVTIPSICLFRCIPLFPEVSSLWFLPFAYVCLARNACSIAESLACGDTLAAWWNLQPMWLIRRTTPCTFAFIDTIIRQLGLSETGFSITAKVADEGMSKRYKQEMMEFGSSSVMFDIIATLAMINLFGLVGGIVKIVWEMDESLIMQIVVCWLVVMVNVPVYQGMFLRSDKRGFPTSVVLKSVVAHRCKCNAKKHISVDKISYQEFKSSSLKSPADSPETVARLFRAPFSDA
ncbi:hypothetical protein HYC85_012400 [Camellia sinensis]|uniref:Cellulose synthase-like protein E6 n=1 Tax=Camellia sinensis TaxID=4442 RepID=A0A7J7HD32_CAMSI|nr:hypothetical protein HYC85_012400 [Camellia sinensis]